MALMFALPVLPVRCWPGTVRMTRFRSRVTTMALMFALPVLPVRDCFVTITLNLR
jgi:hypothetical protein